MQFRQEVQRQLHLLWAGLWDDESDHLFPPELSRLELWLRALFRLICASFLMIAFLCASFCEFPTATSFPLQERKKLPTGRPLTRSD
jgi:hypothetical protein